MRITQSTAFWSATASACDTGDVPLKRGAGASNGSSSSQKTAMAWLRPLTVSIDVLVERTSIPNPRRSTSGRPLSDSSGLARLTDAFQSDLWGTPAFSS